jgi:hypothetical protein
MKHLLVAGLLLTGAFVAFSETIKRASLEEFEHNFDGRLLKNTGQGVFEIMSTTVGSYIDGAGVFFGCRANLLYGPVPNPFSPPFTKAEIAALRQRKLDRIPVLETEMRNFLSDVAASPGFDSVRPAEQIAVSVDLFYYSDPKWEDSTGLPRQITMNAQKQKLLQARRDKVDLATVVQEQKL